jgi:hypothetical protein
MYLTLGLPNAQGSKLPVDDTAQGLEELIRVSSGVSSFVIPKDVNGCQIYVESGSIRFFDDGNTPTADYGMPLFAGDTFTFEGTSIKKLLLVSEVVKSLAIVTIRLGYNE